MTVPTGATNAFATPGKVNTVTLMPFRDQTPSADHADTPDARLVLCMIVKNEAAIIERCLDAALPHVDAYVICDTGSTDGTVEAVRAAGSRLDKPGIVCRHPWKDFGHNRTRSADAARD
jgi:hypothetical protein